MNQPKTPGAMVLLPRVATLEMKNAGWLEAERQGVDPESIEMQTIWFAMSNAAPAEQTPAVGGEPETIAWALCDGDEKPVDFTARWDVAKHWPEYAMPLIDRAHVAPLLAEVEQLRKLPTRWSEVFEQAADLEAAHARIDELEAQQGEPVAYLYTCPSDDDSGPRSATAISGRRS